MVVSPRAKTLNTNMARKINPKKLVKAQFTWSAHTVALCVYLLICLCDFVAMPIYYEWSNQQSTPIKMIALAKTMPPAEQVQVLEILKANRKWEPITDQMFHIAFGTLLTAGVWRGGKHAAGGDDQDGDDDDSPFPPLPQPEDPPKPKPKPAE